MIVYDLHVVRAVILPCETNPPLVVDPLLYCPARSPDSFSSLFPGLEARSPSITALSSMTSLRSAAFLKPENFLTFSPPKKSSVLRS
jgi:hypothetical protein